MCTLTQCSLIKAVKYCIVRRAFKTLCQISGEKKYIVLKKRLKLYRLPYRCHSIGMTTKTGWLSANHTLFPSIYCYRKQRIKISRDMKDKIVSDFLFVLVDSRMQYEHSFFVPGFPPHDKYKHLTASFSSYISHPCLSESHIFHSVNVSATGGNTSSQNLFSYSII